MPSQIIGTPLQRRLFEREKAIREKWQEVFEDTGRDVRAAYLRTVRNWSHRVLFEIILDFSKERYSVIVRPAGRNRRIYAYVDVGTKPHVIRARGGKVLRFQRFYSPRTLPIARASVGTGERFGPWVSKQEVNHPGSRGRRFSREIARQFGADFPRDIREAYQRGYSRGG